MDSAVGEYYDLLYSLVRRPESSVEKRYRLLRDLLEQICRKEMRNERLQMTDLAARINYLATRYGLDSIERNRLHTFRLTSNRILNGEQPVEEDQFLRDVKTISFAVKKMYGIPVPDALYRRLPVADATYRVQPAGSIKQKRMRVLFEYADEEFLYVCPVENISEELLKVRYSIAEVNEEFTSTVRLLWKHAQLNLLDVYVDAQGIYTPYFIVLEPDYLVDISSLAECFKEYGALPANYHLNRLLTRGGSASLLLGNFANHFLDEWIHSGEEVDYFSSMQKVFQKYPIEIAACEELREREKEIQFFQDCKTHFEHIRDVVRETFAEEGYQLNREDAVLEPSYLCESLGLLGRLDYMQRELTAFIEMKSGKADEYALCGKVEPRENHRVQMLLYQAVLEYTMGQDHRQVSPYLLYTRYPLLYPARSSWAQVRRAVDLRNRIVAGEYAIQLHNKTSYTASLFRKMIPVRLNEKRLQGMFWERYLKPPVEDFHRQITSLTPLERDYFFRLYTFIVTEQYAAKTGDTDYQGKAGHAALWLSSLAEKCEAGEILYDLILERNEADRDRSPRVIFTIPVYEEEIFPNFRTGDAVLFYERSSATDNVTNRMIFKGTIEGIAAEQIIVRLRNSQHNRQVLPENSRYALEHDFMDSSFRLMFSGLSLFPGATQKRRDLLLAQKTPSFKSQEWQWALQADNDFERVARKAVAAEDYFLLMGPPGTGKTSRALKRMVELLLQEEDTHILLMAYTNRAVDEICRMLSGISPAVDYIRIGNELSCDIPYRSYLLESRLQHCTKRSEVASMLISSHIIIGTVTAVSGKPDLFKMKNFSVAIVDEASQILETQLLNVLCARDRGGNDAVKKFILIGDHKQLPAVVVQKDIHSIVEERTLREIGMTDMKDSLFERFYRFHTGGGQKSQAIDLLCRQGRMHPEICRYSNEMFYDNRLLPVGLPHQQEKKGPGSFMDGVFPELGNCRVAFIASKPEPEEQMVKMNRCEAAWCAKILWAIYRRDPENFDPEKRVGIITSYRSQIALIRKEIARYNISLLSNVLIDTVERFQGSERDIIIYSVSVNYGFQLDLLSTIKLQEGVKVDRKLNVALTRARKQLFITGVKEIL
ncbi:MAG: AAA domain-containing protein, partial [Bacteroides sp.]|nr:AAA domain-containing protein [Bacteroides sp.]